MTNDEKALLYDDLIRESDRLQRTNSKLKSQYPVSVPPNVQKEINENNKKIDIVVKKLEKLLRDNNV